MKSIIALFIFIFSFSTLFAQTLYTRKDTISITQDSVTLQAGKFRGAIQWQYSPDKKAWNNLNGKTKETFKVIKSAEGYYRAEIIDYTCTPLYSDTALIKPGFNISKNITAQTGGSITTPDNSTLTIPANSLQTDGKVIISTVGENEHPEIANSNLQRFGSSYKLEIPGDTLLHNITLTFTLDSVPSPIENFVPCLYDGDSYIPMEYTINESTLSVIIDVIKWKDANNLKNATSLSKVVIEFFISKQTPPEEEMGLKEVLLVAGKLQFNNPSQTTETSKVLLLVHGWNDRPNTWTSFIQKITAEKNIKFDKIWTFGYNSSWKIEENSTKLADALSKYSNGAKIRIVGHSMGGLVSRSMIEYKGGANYVKKLITMGTPHHGSPMAAIRDWIGKNIIENEESVNESLTGASVIYNCFTQGFKDLQENSDFILKMEKLSQPPLPYYCIAAKQPVDNPKIPGDDDIVVAVESALGVPNAKATAIIDINSFVAHNAMLSNATVYQKVKEYLLDHDKILIVSGNKQTGYPASKLAQPIVVQVQDEGKKPVKSKSVFFSYNQSLLSPVGLKSAQMDFGENKPDTLSLETDDEGKISLDWTLGRNGGDQKFEVFLKDDGNTKIDSSAIKITATACGCDTTKFGHFTDPRDGHVYKTIKIGTQTWMAENLAYLPYKTSTSVWSDTDPCYYAYNYDLYGVLYNWPAALTSCPAGWHLPSDAEWTTLSNYLGGKSVAGGKMKSVTGWNSPNTGATNESCFSALPGGGCYCGAGLHGDGTSSEWWSSTAYVNNGDFACNRFLNYTDSALGWSAVGRCKGFWVRCIKDYDIPTLNTTETTSITTISGIAGGNVISDGGKPVVTRGVCWNTSGTPTITDNKTTDGSGTGTFTSTITGLTPCTTYYLRAYATNSEGTAYGEQITFTTLADKLPCLKTKVATTITDRSATCGGNIISEGTSPVTIRGLCWNTTGSPTIADLITNDGGGTGNFTSNMIALNTNTKYYARAYATNAQGTAYGNEVTFTTLKENVIPEATTHGITDITATSATCGGTVINNNGSAVTVRGICWNTTGNPTTGDSKTNDSAGDGSFTSKMTGLTPNTKYFVRSYATNKNGTGYGGQVVFISNKE